MSAPCLNHNICLIQVEAICRPQLLDHSPACVHSQTFHKCPIDRGLQAMSAKDIGSLLYHVIVNSQGCLSHAISVSRFHRIGYAL